MKRLFFFFILFFTCLTTSYGQRYNFKRYSIEEGLSRSGVYDIYEDSRGFLWLATEGGGIDRFDGKTFINYNSGNGLTSNVIRSIYEDKEGNMWFGTQGKGVIRFDGTSFITYSKSNTNGGILHNTIRDIVQDDEGNMWFGTFGGGVSTFNPSTHEFEVITTENGLPHDKVRSLLKDSNGKIWIGTDGGVAVHNGVKIDIFTTEEGLPHDRILCIFEDGSKQMWLGTPRGVAKYRGKNQGFQIYTNEHGLIQKRVRAITQDNHGNMWFGTREGASRYDGEHFVSFTEHEGLSNNRIRSILFDSAGNLWFGTFFGGLSQYNNDTFAHFTEKDGLPSHQVYALHPAKEDNSLYLGTFEGLTKLNLKENGMISSVKNYLGDSPLPQEKINSLHLDEDHILWMGTDHGIHLFDGQKVTKIDASLGLAGTKVNAIYQNAPKSYWVATDKGASHFKKLDNATSFDINHDLMGNSVYSVFTDSKDYTWFGHGDGEVTIVKGGKAHTFKIPTASHNIIKIVEDRHKNIWLATEGDGLFSIPLFEAMPDSLSTTNYEIKDGLNSNFLHLMILDEIGHLWLGTERGIDKLTFDAKGKLSEIKHYGKAEGFVGIETNKNAVTIDTHGQIWFGTIKGVSRYSYLTRNKNTKETRTHIIKILINQKPTDWEVVSEEAINLNWFHVPRSSPTLSYTQNNLTFSFTGINLRMPSKVRYKWKLGGLEEKWSEASSQAEVNYSHLSPGDYTFMVQSCNEDGVWNKIPATFSFNIKKPFWQAYWFYAVIIAASYLTFFAFFKWRTKRLMAAKANLELLVEDRTIEIRETNAMLQQQKEELNATLDQIKLQNATIQEEREKTESLLLNILPKATAEELRSKGTATPKSYELVTIMFTDFKGFTQVAESLTPTELVKELEYCFVGFDEILDRHNLEKIKTIGDSYMCAGGIPIANDSNPIDAVRAGLEIQDFMKEWKANQKVNNRPFWDVRVGIHTGEVVAGVVGKKKFAYDIWGDAVNLASRMESGGEPGRVNISEATYEYVKKEFDCEYRGKVKAKNKGMVDMYFVNGELEEKTMS